jgi:hypothetical protein
MNSPHEQPAWTARHGQTRVNTTREHHITMGQNAGTDVRTDLHNGVNYWK